jgi:hypothetical protein
VREELIALGVRPIFVSKFDEIPDLLGAVYTAGLKKDHPGGQVELPKYAGRRIILPPENHPVSHTKIWKILYTSHQCRPGVFGEV